MSEPQLPITPAAVYTALQVAFDRLAGLHGRLDTSAISSATALAIGAALCSVAEAKASAGLDLARFMPVPTDR